MNDDDDVQISVEATDGTSEIEISVENVTEEEVQRRTFSHWPHGPQFTKQVIEAGFFGCNIGDRVICMQCNRVYQHWSPHIDDPSEVHRITSPDCPYVRSRLMGPTVPPPPPPLTPSHPLPVLNNNLSRTVDVAQSSAVPTPVYSMINCDEIVSLKFACNPAYTELPARIKTFHKWNNNSPSVDDLTQAGFFYTGTRDIVTCFYCNGSLKRWGPNHNPMVEHARYFPGCAYARQLCGHELYQRIEKSKRLQQERPVINRRNENENYSEARSNTSNLNINRLSWRPDEQLLSRLVAARLDLPISQRLLDQNFPLAIIRRAWEDQLRSKESDFFSAEDLRISCLIIQKQIESINGNRSNIIIANVAMAQNAHPLSHEPDDLSQRTTTVTEPDNSLNDSRPSKICFECHEEEAHLACIPCGHLVTCDSCRRSLAVCPACQREIKAFVRIYQ